MRWKHPTDLFDVGIATTNLLLIIEFDGRRAGTGFSEIGRQVIASCRRSRDGILSG